MKKCLLLLLFITYPTVPAAASGLSPGPYGPFALRTGIAVVERSEDYLPLSRGRKWVLRSPAEKTPVIYEVLSVEGNYYTFRSTTPWGSSEWILKKDGQRYYMTNYSGMPLPEETLYFDFTAEKGAKWKNAIGTMKIKEDNASVKGYEKEYSDVILIHQSSGNLTMGFAPGVGFVQFGEGKSAFRLDESASELTEARSMRNAPVVDQRATTRAVPDSSIEENPETRMDEPSRPVSGKLPPVGAVPTIFANEPDTPSTRIKRYEQTVEAGIDFMAAYGKWNEIEPKKGEYRFDTLNFQVALARKNNYRMSYTFQIIDTVTRGLPSDLSRKSFSDQEMEQRLERLLDRLVPVFSDRVKWVMIGNEIDSYFNRHRGEIDGFVSLFRKAKRRIQEINPSIQVSSTLQFNGLDELNGRLKALNSELDFLAVTYGPYNPDWTVQNPDVVPRDFSKMISSAGSRRILLQEVAYPSSPVNRSSEKLQAEFYQLSLIHI